MRSRITDQTRTRAMLLLCLVVVVAAGLFARSHRAGADSSTVGGFLATYAGDTLWAVMFFLVGRLLFPDANRWLLFSGTLALTLSIEISQVWQPTFLRWLRELPGIGFVLGRTFLWSDIVCLLVGSILAVTLDSRIAKSR